MNLEQLYLRLPAPLQHAACTLEGARIRHRRYGPAFDRLLEEAKTRARWSQAEVVRYRDARLAAYLRHCATTIPRYRALFHDLGLEPDAVRSLEDLERLPILTKPTVQERAGAFVSDAPGHGRTMWAHTSGTTGGGLRFPVTRSAHRAQWAVWWRFRGWHGIEQGTWCGYFGGRLVVPADRRQPPFWRYDLVGRQILFSAYHLSPDTIPLYVAELRRRRPPWLSGYPSLLALIASYLVETGSTLGYEVRWVTPLAENLLPQQRALLERAFGVPPRQHYGMAEGAANFSECELGHLHVDEDYAAVEFVPAAHPDVHRVIGTAFTNAAYGFVRYDVHDHVILGSGACPCGRPGRLVAAIDGRQEDYVILADGTRLGRLDHILKDLTNVREAQVVQRDVGHLTFRIVRGERYGPADELVLRREAAQRLGADADVTLEYVDRLERGPTGKLRFVVSHVDTGRLEQVAERNVP